MASAFHPEVNLNAPSPMHDYFLNELVVPAKKVRIKGIMPIASFIHDMVQKARRPRTPPAKLPIADQSIADSAGFGAKQDAQRLPAYTQPKFRFRDIGRMNAIIETLGDFLTAMPTCL